MKVIKTIAVGEKGSVKFVKKWGKQLLLVRYREDEKNQDIVTTLEIVVETRAKMGKNKRQIGHLSVKSKAVVGVRIGIDVLELRAKVKAAEAIWDSNKMLWRMRYEDAIALGLKNRIVN